MIASIEFLKEKFNKYNEEFFNGELPPIKIQHMRAKHYLGVYRFKRNNVTRKETPVVIKITKYYDLSEKAIIETLLHEMVHYYQSVKDLGRRESAHGPTFQRIVKEIESKSDFKLTGHTANKIVVPEGKVYTLLEFDYNGSRRCARVASNMTAYRAAVKWDIENPKIRKSTNSNCEKLKNCVRRLNTYFLDEKFRRDYF